MPNPAANLLAVAEAAVLVFPERYQTVMVAIAGAETGGTWDPSAQGDRGLDPQYGLCDGYSSWGPFQIHNVHRAYLERQSGSSDPCAWYAWLTDPVHSARAALSLLSSAPGLGNWTTYNSGAYRVYLTRAQMAIATARAQTPGAPLPSPSPWLLAAAAGATLAGVGALILLVDAPLRQEIAASLRTP